MARAQANLQFLIDSGLLGPLLVIPIVISVGILLAFWLWLTRRQPSQGARSDNAEGITPLTLHVIPIRCPLRFPPELRGK